MTDFYDCFVDLVKECLADFDCRTTKIKLVRHSGREMNSVTRELDTGTTAEPEITGVTVPYNSSVIDGTTIQTGDIRVVIDSVVVPFKDDDVIIDGNNFSIISTTTFNPGGVILGYDLQVRR